MRLSFVITTFKSLFHLILRKKVATSIIIRSGVVVPLSASLQLFPNDQTDYKTKTTTGNMIQEVRVVPSVNPHNLDDTLICVKQVTNNSEENRKTAKTCLPLKAGPCSVDCT